MTVEQAGPRSGDRVRANRSNREALEVEGILYLRYVPSLDYVQVTLLDESGRLDNVNPATIKVVEAGVVDIEQLEDGEPLIGEPGWRRVTDLDAAIADGLVTLESGDGMSWDALLEEMRGILKPLVDAGWEVIREETEQSEDDCVVCFLRRATDHLSVDHYPDGWTNLWETDSDFWSDELTPTFGLGPDDPVAVVRTAFGQRGWI
jgi:hypothetical protein